MLVSDHPHLFETGGENYHTDFNAWEYVRGHEGDPWKTVTDPSAVGAPEIPQAKPASVPRPYDVARSWFREESITYHVRKKGVVTMLVSDHPHLFETGGENYHTDFNGWEYVRGHEGDPWKTVADPSAVGAPEIPEAKPAAVPRPYDVSRSWFREESDFPGPKTMATAADWLRANASRHERFLLFVDEFDPHEPFDTPEPYASQYDPGWEGPKLIWPPYAVGPIAKGRMPARDGHQVRANYGSSLTMIDHWFGKLLDAIDELGLADDTMIVLCSDHGHYLGEKTVDDLDIWGKPAATPLPEGEGSRAAKLMARSARRSSSAGSTRRRGDPACRSGRSACGRRSGHRRAWRTTPRRPRSSCRGSAP